MKMEPDREIESSKTEMETDEETFERDASAVPEDCLVKKYVPDFTWGYIEPSHQEMHRKHEHERMMILKTCTGGRKKCSHIVNIKCNMIVVWFR